MSGEPINSIERYPFFISLDKKLKYNKHFMIVTDTNITCNICKTEFPICIDRADLWETQMPLLLSHIEEEDHLNNVINYIFSKAFPNSEKVKNHYTISSLNTVYCLGCHVTACHFLNIEIAIRGMRVHNLSKRHIQQFSKPVSRSTRLKSVKAPGIDQPMASTSNCVTVTSNHCSVCEIPIEVFNQDLSLSYEVHDQSEQHLSACHKKLKSIFVKYRSGNNENCLTELFHIYPILFDQLVNCELFIDKLCYFLCNICKIQIPSVNVISVNNEIYKHLKSSDNCRNEYLNKIFDEYLGTQNGCINETNAFKENCTGEGNYDEISELFQSFPSYLKNNPGVICTVGNSLYCTLCSCSITVHSDKSQTLKNLEVHLETVHSENILNKIFELIPDIFQSDKKIVFYKGDFIMCSLCNIIGIPCKPLKIKQTAASVMQHLKGKQHQNKLCMASTAAQPVRSPSTATNQSTETSYSTTDKSIESLLLRDPKTATLLKQNCRFLQVQNNDFVCTLCNKKVADLQANAKVTCNSIIQHFRSKTHALVTINMNQNQNVSLWKLVYDCYAPEWIKSNEECIQKIGDRFRCTICSFDITDKETENVMEKLLRHITSDQHKLVKVFTNFTTSPKS